MGNMTKDDELHRLVRSMTPSEKRQFTLHARRHLRNPQYLRLFMALDKQESYDPAIIRKSFAGSATERHMSELRHTLLEELLECLERLPSLSGIESRLQRELKSITFLASRSCMVTAERRLRRALAVAEAHELPTMMLDLCATERMVAFDSPRALRAVLEREQIALALAQDAIRAQADLEQAIDEATSSETPRNLSISDGLDLRDVTSVLGRIRVLHAHMLRASCRHDVATFLRTYQDFESVIDHFPAIAEAHDVDVMLARRDAWYEAQLLGCDMLRPSEQQSLRLPMSPRHDVAQKILLAVDHVVSGDFDRAIRDVHRIIDDPQRKLLHRRWTAQGILISIAAHVLRGDRRIVPYLVRNALRTEERKLRFTSRELQFLRFAMTKRNIKPPQLSAEQNDHGPVLPRILQLVVDHKSSTTGSASRSRSVQFVNTIVLLADHY